MHELTAMKLRLLTMTECDLRIGLFSFGLVTALAGCQSFYGTSGMRDADSVEIFVTENLVEEKCRVQQSFDSEITGLEGRQFEIFCGRWEHASGNIFEVDPTAETSTLDRWTESGVWKEWLDKRLICEPGARNSILDEVQAQMLPCKLRNGDWPYVVMVAKVGQSTYLGDGIPAVLPVLEEGIGLISGRLDKPSAVTADSRAAALRRMQAVIKGPIYGAGSLRKYYRLMTAGQFYNSIKDFTTAAMRYREALAAHERIMGDLNPGIADPMMHLALEISNQGRFAEAELLFERVAALSRKSSDRSDYARYLSYRALHSANMRRFNDALKNAREATKLRKDLALHKSERADVAGQSVETKRRADFAVFATMDAPTVVDIVQSLYIEAAMLERLGKLPEAEKVLREAKTILMRSREVPPSWEPEIKGLVARVAKAKGAETERGEHLTSAVSLWEEFAPGERPSVINYLKLGEAFRAQKRLDDAMAAFRQAIGLVKSRSGSLAYDQLQDFFRTSLDLAGQRPENRKLLYAEMFEAGQLVRSEITTQTIALAVARLAATEDATGEVIRNFQEAQDTRYMLYRKYESEAAKRKTEEQVKKLKNLRARLEDVEQRLEDLSLQVQSAFPRYNQLVDSVIDAERVIDLIQPDEALVQVLLGTDDGILFVVNDSTIRAVPIDISLNEAGEIVNKLRSGIEPNPDGTMPDFDASLAHLLYRRLFNPVIDEIDVDHLITIPTGPFLSLPFAVLVTEKPGPISEYDYSKVEWLANRSAISLLPSVHSFVGLRGLANSTRAPKAYIGFGDFVPHGNRFLEEVSISIPEECRVRPDLVDAHRQKLLGMKSLPNTALEVSEVAKTFSSSVVDVMLGRDFTDQAVKTLALRDYRILHFATHGLLPTQLECQPQPSLVTSLPDSPEGNSDGLLDIEDILQLRLDAELVVLSACNTGGPGSATGGESLSGLARAFFFVGARSLIVSHWVAADITSADLIIRMFKHMRNTPGIGWASALRHAQLSLLDDAKDPSYELYSHPLLWAVFTVVGDGAQGVSQI